MITLSIAKDFTKTPGFRYQAQSPTTSGEQFRDDLLDPKYLEAVAKGEKLVIILDGTDGYLTSFLEEAFGGLKRKHPEADILKPMQIVSNDEPHWIEDIHRYVQNALVGK